ncbi:hypothetical protein Nepgr_008227 [Nepenthes gracilis]|uniref:Uncharacterized protein n=1 Tax=Nepenthes gracilis TaxID=150966 RepID=A0AAD3XJ08_NEPGR|nr:hypothetical protein Nepgr_008227 [Nepenthes gracilis]
MTWAGTILQWSKEWHGDPFSTKGCSLRAHLLTRIWTTDLACRGYIMLWVSWWHHAHVHRQWLHQHGLL